MAKKTGPPPSALTPALRARVETGRDRRASVPLESHAEVSVPEVRPDPVQILLAQDEGRVASLVPIRHARMNATPFTFFRGAAAIMASDLSRGASSGLTVQLCGDAHLSNFGLFNGADRRLVFDVNDFDETLPGPFEWDLKRLAASVSIAARHNGLAPKEARTATRAAVRGYRKAIAASVVVSPLDLLYYRVDVARYLEEREELHKGSRREIDKASRKDSLRALAKLTEVVDGRRRIVPSPPLIVPLGEELGEPDAARIRTFFDRYRQSLPPYRAAVIDRYRFLDLAHKVVGVGSVGTRCFIVLLESDGGAPLFLQFKEATRSVLEPFLGPSQYAHSGERVVQGQRSMQATGDVLLGWSHAEADGRTVEFYLRQLWDGKASAAVDEMGPKRLKRYAALCGGTLALAHARTGDAAAIHGYLGEDRTADDVFADFAERYADLNESDHAAHAEAIRAGRVAVAE
ncbi:DUF2252 domain-containing protein [Demequina sp. NBRC 110054]|uniref:DUF2252 domain-containing protein n=1 Tax=Demequina sp. NBRC 110054 TaxID=1570343 RepID=UPI000A01AAFC|nr:DUF2252 domain-containing protein [Demequina sp. NBRC 110054]